MRVMIDKICCHTPTSKVLGRFTFQILAWQISLSAETFTEQSEPETAPELVICEDLEGQLEQILVTTEAALGMERVRACLSLLTAARRGLDDTEILDLLAHDDLFRSEETYCKFPFGVFRKNEVT